MTVQLVASSQEMATALQAAGLTPTPVPAGHTVEVGELVIEREVRETSFCGCEHAVSTDRFSGEIDYCAVCEKLRTVR